MDPKDLEPVLGGRLLDAHFCAAMDEIASFDAMVKEGVEGRRWFPATFRLSANGMNGAGEVRFANGDGFAQLYGDAWPAGGCVPVERDDDWGLLPMLRKLAQRSKTTI